jgi:hypothetical protein
MSTRLRRVDDADVDDVIVDDDDDDDADADAFSPDTDAAAAASAANAVAADGWSRARFIAFFSRVHRSTRYFISFFGFLCSAHTCTT